MSDFILTKEELSETVKAAISKSIKEALASKLRVIEQSVDSYFDKSQFEKKASEFEKGLNWAVESAFQDGLKKAMVELDFVELVAQKAKVILADNDFIARIAELKVRQALGLLPEDNS